MDGSRKEGMTSQSPNRRRGTSRRLMCPLAFSTPEEESTWLREGEGDETEEKKRQLLLSPQLTVLSEQKVLSAFVSLRLCYFLSIHCLYCVYVMAFLFECKQRQTLFLDCGYQFMRWWFCVLWSKLEGCFAWMGKPHAEKQNKLIFESILATSKKSSSTNNLCGRWMCPTRGSCCFLPGPQFNTGGQRGCWYPCFLQWVPLPFITWPVWGDRLRTTARSLALGLFFFFINTNWKHSTCTYSWKSEHHAVSRVHLPLPFFSVEPLLAVCRLSAATTSLADYQSELVLQGSNLHFWFRHQTGFLLCLRPALRSIFWRNAPECLHDLVLIWQHAVAKLFYY